MLGTHVDDIFGGFKDCQNYHRATHFREFLCDTGTALTIYFNKRIEKTPLPARCQIILGRKYDSRLARICTAEKKVFKYRLRIAAVLAVDVISIKSLEKLHGCLNYVAEVEPFGRPFLAHLTTAISDAGDKEVTKLSELAKIGLKI